MQESERKQIIELIEKVINSYERMLQKVVIEGNKDLNSDPYVSAMQALKKVLGEEA